MEADAFIQTVVIDRGLSAALNAEMSAIEESSLWSLEHVPEGNSSFEYI